MRMPFRYWGSRASNLQVKIQYYLRNCSNTEHLTVSPSRKSPSCPLDISTQCEGHWSWEIPRGWSRHAQTDISRRRLIKVMGTTKCNRKKSIILIILLIPRTTKERKRYADGRISSGIRVMMWAWSETMGMLMIVFTKSARVDAGIRKYIQVQIEDRMRETWS